MSRLDPGKLTVEFMEGVTETFPMIPRRYTLTHSDETADLFLTIGPDFVFDKISNMRDEVLGEWLLVDRSIRYYVYLQMEGAFGQKTVEIRENIFRQELPLALEAIRYGDRRFFDTRPDMDHYPIIVYFLYENPEDNKAENWGTFSAYDITVPRDHVMANSMMEHRVLIDEKLGDINGDGVPDRASIYGDKTAGSDFIHSIIIEIEGGPPGWFKVDMITEVNGYNPTLFLGDFTKNHAEDILFRMDMMFNSMNSNDKGQYGIAIDTLIDNHLETIFVSDMYNTEYRFLVEYKDFYKISIMNVKENKLFFLDISYMGNDYLSLYYKENGELIKPVQGEVLKADAFIPIIGSEQENYYDLLAVHRIIGNSDSDTLGYIDNLLSWNGERFESIRMMASTPGTELIPEVEFRA